MCVCVCVCGVDRVCMCVSMWLRQNSLVFIIDVRSLTFD